MITLSRILAFTVLLLAMLPAPARVRAVPPDGGERVRRGAQSARAARVRRARQRRARLRRYGRMVRRWHRRAPRSARRAWEAMDPRPLVLRPVGRAESFELVPDASGRFDEEDLARAEQALRHRDGGSHPVHPRLVELVHRAVQHFEVPWVHVVSGYRPDRDTSRHTQGRAVDIVLPGVSDRGLARYLARQGFVGVGIYTRSGFVHLDVRERSYFWIDRSAPGQRQRIRPIMRAAARRWDARARRRGEEPVPDVVPEGDDADASDGAPEIALPTEGP